MHELAVAEEIVAAALGAADLPGGGSIERVHVVIGTDSHLDAEILGEAFSMSAAGTVAAGAVLNLEVPSDLCVDCAGDLAVAPTGLAVTAIDVTG
jgi:Zn finger protein HypA/HybF involved in hydrogenase expression